MALPAGVTVLGSFKGVKGDPGTFVDAHAIPVAADETDIKPILSGPPEAREITFKQPRGLPGVNAVENDEAVSVYVAAPDSDTRAALDNAYGRFVSIAEHGAVANGTTDDWAAWLAAKALAGVRGTVYFPALPGAAETVYMLSPTVRRSLAGTHIKTDPSVVLKGRFDPDVKLWGAITDITVDNIELGRKQLKPAPRPALDPYAAAAAIIPDGAEPAAQAWDGGGWTKEGFGGGVAPYTSVANGLTAVGALASWPTGFAGSAGYEGMQRVPVIGELYTVLGQSTSGGGYLGMAVISADLHIAGFRNPGASPTWPGFGTTTMMTLGSYTLNGLYGNPGLSGGVTMGIRVVDLRTVEFYVNGRLLGRRSTLKDIAKIAFVSTASQALNTTLEYPMTYGIGYVPTSTHRIGTVSIVGDSISYGAWNTVTWPDLLPTSLGGLPNGGDVVVRQNIAVSGSSAADWAPGGSIDITNFSFTGDKYVCVLLGTNGGETLAPSTFTSQLNSIAAKIKADGATPIFGVFPFWSNTSLSGLPGAVVGAPGRVQRLRQALAYWASQSGNKYELALVQDTFGDNHNWLDDNIHPKEFGQAAVSRAFANAIARAEKRAVTA